MVVIVGWMNVVMRVAIVLNQSASMLVAGELDSVWVDGVDGREEGLSIVHDNGRFVVVGGGGELWVRLGIDVGVAADDGQVDTVGAATVGDLGLVGTMVVRIIVGWLGQVVVDVSVVVVASVVLVARWVDIVVGIAVVGDQGAASFVAGELNFISVDVINRGNDWLSVNLDDCLVWRYSGSSELWVNVSISLDVASSHSKFNTMGTLWLIVVSGVLMSTVPSMVVAAMESITNRQLSFAAGQDASASIVHLFCESELLAVKNKGVAVGIELGLGPNALLAASSHLNVCVEVGLLIDGVVLINVILIRTDSCTIVRNLIANSMNIIAQVVDRGLESLERHEHLSLDLDSLFVVILIPDLLVLIELVYLSIEVGTWKFFAIWLGIIGLSVVTADRETGLAIEAMPCPLSLEAGGAGGVGACSESDSEFHNFIFKFLTNMTY